MDSVEKGPAFICECCGNWGEVPCSCLTEIRHSTAGPQVWCIVHQQWLPEGL